MQATLVQRIQEAVINGVAYVLIRAAALAYFSVMSILAVWSIAHSLVLPPAYA